MGNEKGPLVGGPGITEIKLYILPKNATLNFKGLYPLDTKFICNTTPVSSS